MVTLCIFVLKNLIVFNKLTLSIVQIIYWERGRVVVELIFDYFPYFECISCLNRLDWTYLINKKKFSYCSNDLMEKKSVTYLLSIEYNCMCLSICHEKINFQTKSSCCICCLSSISYLCSSIEQVILIWACIQYEVYQM